MVIGDKEFIDSLEKMTLMDIHSAVSQGIRLVQSEAKLLCPVNYGELRDSIYTETKNEPDYVCAACYTNKKYGPYVEFGTGPKGQENHKGISPDIEVSYVQSPWWIHESEIDPKDAEKYHWFFIDTPKGRFYQCSGQAAQPFMYPAIKNQEKNIIGIFAKEIEKKK